MNHGFRIFPLHAAFALLATSTVLGGSLVQYPATASPGDHPPQSSPSHHSPAHPDQTSDPRSDSPSNHSADQADPPSNHHHQTLEIPADQPIPTVQVVVHPDAMQGWNLEIQTTHFRFAPEHVNQAHQSGIGHGHLYINGEKQGRVYGPWLHLAQLPPGANEITVSLNANGHEALTHNGQPIAATVVIEVPVNGAFAVPPSFALAVHPSWVAMHHHLGYPTPYPWRGSLGGVFGALRREGTLRAKVIQEGG
jgi:hypothetical protein